MNRKLIITKIEEKIWTALFENDVLAELHCTPLKEEERNISLGNIYVGKVKNVLPNIGAAFIEIADGVECYYSVYENPRPIFTHKTGKKGLCIGDELLVQVSKEAQKTKAPTVSSKLNFTGKYAVLTTGDTRLGISSKIPKEDRERFEGVLATYASDAYGLIVRTNAADADMEVIEREIKTLINEYERIIENGKTRVCFSCLKTSSKQYLTELRNIYQNGLMEIVVEDTELYLEVKQFLSEEQPEDLKNLRFYQDTLLPLHKLYSIEKHISEALREHVWLKSGAYLIIQPTEALTVIDVNSGKSTGEKRKEDTSLRVNLEAAQEVARQIRLRNLSGIIVVDFINMQNPKHMDLLLETLNRELQKDAITTTLVDVTALQLVEITRKKVRKPLHEAVRE